MAATLAGTQIVCGSQRRRALVAAHATLNGIDHLEVLDADAIAVPSPRQRSLLLRFLKPVPAALGAANIVIDGGERVTPVQVLWSAAADAVAVPPATAAEQAFFAALPEPDHVLVLRTDSEGDFSTYVLRLVDAPGAALAALELDPQLSALEFSFKAECPSDFDCRNLRVCPPEKLDEPGINYLAKDYASFRRLLLDRVSALMPQWQSRSPADLGIALIELAAHVGDQLSYYQDAVATEAYLGTARSRVSVRRHARLLDYRMHEGCNARVWVAFEVAAGSGADGAVLAKGQVLLTAAAGAPPALAPAALAQALQQQPVIFETLHGITLRQVHNRLRFHTWSDEECCLPRGAIRATLLDGGQQLTAGDALLLEEVIGPATGAAADADPARRHVVRLTRAVAAVDALDATPLVEIEWAADDALPFAFCLSRRYPGVGLVTDIGIACANVVLADHGRTLAGDAAGLSPAVVPALGSYRPRLAHAGITQAAPFDAVAARSAAARRATRQVPGDALPQAMLRGDGHVWQPRFDLLASGRYAAEFVLEAESDGSAQLRFGDDALGRRPSADAVFTAEYRVGNGAGGNVGRDAIARMVTPLAGIERLRNPIAAAGGTDPEPLAQVRFDAPQAFRSQERAVTEDDYARAAERHPDVQRAAARFRWTGSWYTVFVSVDRRGGRPVDAAFRREMRLHLERFRLAGYDLEIRPPLQVPLQLVLQVCVKDGHFRADVQQALLRVLGAADLADGRRGFFHPDNFSFGDPLYLSRIVAAASAVDGVASVQVTTLQRWGKAPAGELDAGIVQPSALEILQLANDPSLPERGRLEVDAGGGL